ncbi:integrase [Paraburkholderia youngii]
MHELKNVLFCLTNEMWVGYRKTLGVTRWFARATAKLGLHLPDGRRPTLHSLRHSFAIHRLTQWYEDGASAGELAPTLSVYLGHVSPRESYWYVSATPELLGSASDRFRVFAALGD